MVAIKVQSLKDIVIAYFKSIGFSGAKLEKAADVIIKRYSSDFEKNDVICILEQILEKNLEKNFSEVKLEPEQKKAWFKAVFLLLNGADKWGVDAFIGENVDKGYIAQIKGYGLYQIPEYKLSHMEAQKIVSPNPLKMLGRIFRKNTRRKK